MQFQKLTMKPRAPQQRAVEAAMQKGEPAPIARKEFELQIPFYTASDVIEAVSQNDQAVLNFIARLINAEVTSGIKNQLSDEEIFPLTAEVDVANFDIDALKLETLANQPEVIKLADIEFTEEQTKKFISDFVSFMAARYASNPRAPTLLTNVAEILTSGFKAIAKDEGKIQKSSKYADEFFSHVPEDLLEEHQMMYLYIQGMRDRRLRSLAKAQEKTEIDLD